MRELAVVFDPERKLFLYSSVALLAAFFGPFGTYDVMTFWERMVFWFLDVFGGMVIIVPIVHVFFYSRLTAFIPAIFRFLLGIALGALPTAAYITVLFSLVGPRIEITTPYPVLIGQVVVFSTILLLTEFVLWPAIFGDSKSTLVGSGDDDVPETPKQAKEQSTIPLLSRLPIEHRGGAIISISMQDHYAEITTTKGVALLLMRLTDAIDLLNGCPGCRIHRSHWVAQEHISSIEKEGRRVMVWLTDGRRLPVGATYVDTVKQLLQSARN